MENQEQNSVEEEAAPQELDENESQVDVNETEASDSVEEKEEDAQEKNWRAMRQRQKEMEWQLKQKDEMLNKFMELQKQTQTPIPQDPEEPEVDDDEYIPAAGVKGIAKRTVQPLEKKIQYLENRIAEQEQQKLMDSIKAKYSDFDDIVNVETLEILEKTEPELAKTIADSKDPYKMCIQSYKYIKALGLVDSLPKAKREKEISKKIDKNAKTVQSPLAYDKRPMAQAFKSTAADKKRLYEEMMHYAGQASGL